MLNEHHRLGSRCRERARARTSIRQYGDCQRSALFGILKQEHPIKTCSSIRVLRETGVDILRGRAIVFSQSRFFFSSLLLSPVFHFSIFLRFSHQKKIIRNFINFFFCAMGNSSGKRSTSSASRDRPKKNVHWKSAGKRKKNVFLETRKKN